MDQDGAHGPFFSWIEEAMSLGRRKVDPEGVRPFVDETLVSQHGDEDLEV